MDSFTAGVILTFMMMISVITNTDKRPMEQPMIEKCQSLSTELRSYDHWDFQCSNGASFSVSSVTKYDTLGKN